ncbi:MAG: Nif3-like dinuclear metal center hexameric protein, partial [Candidatus Flemingiibacterium sp.]
MKASEIINELFALSGWESDRTCDTIKSGSPDAVVTKVAVSMFATPEVVKNAHEWGAELLIVHEPTYYNHMDEHSDEAIETE